MSKEKILTIPECALLLAIVGVRMDKNDPTNRFMPKSTDRSESPIRDLVKESYYCLEHGCPPTYRGYEQVLPPEEKKEDTGKQLSFLDNPLFQVKEEKSMIENVEISSDELFALCDKMNDK